MGNVLYEVSYKFEIGAFIPLFMVIMIPVIGLRNRNFADSLGAKIFLGVAWCFTLAVTVVVGIHQIRMYTTVTGAYRDGEYQTVEGYVENFHPMPPEGHDTEDFDIQGVSFSYSDYTVMTGYHNAKSKGGVITGDGQYLKIGYVQYNGENVIVYIEELPAPEGSS